MKSVGLTGGIASGKSTVATMLRQRGVPVLDADQVARQVVEPSHAGLERVVAHFGPSVLTQTGHLDRPRLGALVSQDAQARTALEAILHPLIGERVRAWLQRHAGQGANVAVVEAALMVETGSWRHYDALLVVRAPPELQIRRLVQDRSMSPEAAHRWLDTQLSVEDKVALATAVIDNDADLQTLAQSLDRAWARLMGEPPTRDPTQ